MSATALYVGVNGVAQKVFDSSDFDKASHNYSTTEQKVGTWIDGKPIYQKTIAITANIPYNNWSNTGVVIQDAKTVITVPQARPQIGSSDMYFLAYFETGGVLCVMNMRNVDYGNNYAFYITVQYTKSTD